MNKLGIWAIAIAGAFVIGVLSANPVVEAVGGWQPAVDGLDARITALENQPAPEARVYEVSGTTTIEAGQSSNEIITLLCLDGDWKDSTTLDFVTVPPIHEDGISLVHDTQTLNIVDPISEASSGTSLTKRIGVSTLPEFIGSGTPFDFDVDVTVTMVCISPS